MKKVLIIDSHQLFRDFLKQKLSNDQIDVVIAASNREAYTKTLSAPNLIILDMDEDNIAEMEYLERKSVDPNMSKIPVIITGPKIDKSYGASLANYGVHKYFAKPIQFDIFFDAIGKILHSPLSMDRTPCVLDLHRNGSIIFIELALGLNRDKIALIQYKLTEMIERNEIENPKVIIMLTALELSFIDGYNLEFLIENVLASPKVHTKSVKILTLDKFVGELVDGHPAYNGIETATNLTHLMGTLIDNTSSSKIPDLITNRILTPEYEQDQGFVGTKFASDKNPSEEDSENQDDGNILTIAIIDSNPQILELSAASLAVTGATIKKFKTGHEFVNSYQQNHFNLIVMDIFLEDNFGFGVLNFIRNQDSKLPILVYTQVLQKDIVLKVLSSGAKSYLQKPQKPAILVQKALSLLKGNES